MLVLSFFSLVFLDMTAENLSVSAFSLVSEVSIGLVSAVLMELSIAISGQRHAVHRFLMVNILIMFGKEMVYPGVMDSCFSSSCLTLGEINLF